MRGKRKIIFFIRRLHKFDVHIFFCWVVQVLSGDVLLLNVFHLFNTYRSNFSPVLVNASSTQVFDISLFSLFFIFALNRCTSVIFRKKSLCLLRWYKTLYKKQPKKYSIKKNVWLEKSSVNQNFSPVYLRFSDLNWIGKKMLVNHHSFNKNTTEKSDQ